MENRIISIDQSTSSTKAMLFDENGHLLGRRNVDHRQYYPQIGWVEHDALEIWDACRAAVKEAMEKAGADPREIACIGIDHEGESVVMWDSLSGEPISPAIVWQDRRTASAAELLAEQHGDLIRERTGLKVLDIEIGHIDFLRDVAYIKMTYPLEKGKINNSIDLITKFK